MKFFNLKILYTVLIITVFVFVSATTYAQTKRFSVERTGDQITVVGEVYSGSVDDLIARRKILLRQISNASSELRKIDSWLEIKNITPPAPEINSTSTDEIL